MLVRTAKQVFSLAKTTSIRSWPLIAANLWRLNSGQHTTENSKNCIKINIHNKHYNVTIRESTSDFLIFTEVFASPNYSELFSLLPFRPTSWLDLGAHIGLTTILANAFWELESIVCVEPVPESLAIIHSNLRENGLNYTAVQAVVSNSSESTTLYKNKWWSSNTICKEISNKRRAKGRAEREQYVGTEEVSSLTMDDLINKFGSGGAFDIVKMDIEGAEERVFENPEWLNKINALVIEIHSKYVNADRIKRVIDSHNLKYVANIGDNFLFVKKFKSVCQ